MKKYKNILTLAVFLGVSVGAQASNIVQNPGFETGNFSNWTQFGNTGATAVNTNLPHSGTFAAEFGPVGSLGGITQFLTTVTGTTYVLDFWLQNNGNVPSEWIVEWNGASIIDSVNPGGFGYTHFFFSQVATGTTTQLSFRFRQDPSFFHLDDVNVDAVPEPATMAMFGSGLLALGLWRRRKA